MQIAGGAELNASAFFLGLLTIQASLLLVTVDRILAEVQTHDEPRHENLLVLPPFPPQRPAYRLPPWESRFSQPVRLV